MIKSVKTSVTFETQSDKLFSCIVDHEFKDYGLIGYGPTARDAEADIATAIRELRELGHPDAPDIDIIQRKFDVGAFFSYYPFFNITQLAKFTGLNPTQVRQYASGVRRPTQQKKEQLNEAIRSIVATLSQDSRAFCID